MYINWNEYMDAFSEKSVIQKLYVSILLGVESEPSVLGLSEDLTMLNILYLGIM